MTLPPDRIGDKGQRYEVRVAGYPKDGENVVGWATNRDGAYELGMAFAEAPGAVYMTLIDRSGELPPFTRHFGALR